MAPCARFAETDLPPEIHAHFQTPHTLTSIAGYCVVSSPEHGTHIVAIAAGSTLDPLALASPKSTSPSSLSAWLTNPSQGVEGGIGVAILTLEGILRIYPHIDVRNGAIGRCAEVKTGSLLEGKALRVFKHDGLYVFGGGGRVVWVGLDGRAVERISGGGGSVLYNARRRLGMTDVEWEEGRGEWRIVEAGVRGGELIVMRAGGEIERWGNDGCIGRFSVGEEIFGGGVSEEGVIVMTEDRLKCFDSHGTRGMEVEVKKGKMVVSGGVCYVWNSGDLIWISVMWNVGVEGQIRGSAQVGGEEVLDAMDACVGLQVDGGVAAFVHSRGVWLASCAVPGPGGVGEEGIWRALLQWEGEQKGACRESLKGCLGGIGVSVSGVCRRVVGGGGVMIDWSLEKRLERWWRMMEMLEDKSVFEGVREDAESVTEDRVWCAMKKAEREQVLKEGEMLGSAKRVRDVENRGTGVVGEVMKAVGDLYAKPWGFDRFLAGLEKVFREGYEQGKGNEIVDEVCEATVACVSGGRDVREKVVELMENVPGGIGAGGGWLGDGEDVGGVLMRIAERALEVGSAGGVRVLDEMLSRTGFEESVRRGRRVRRTTGGKRRRLELGFEGSERGRELRSALDMLNRFGRAEEMYKMAEKYGDFATMLKVQVQEEDFDNFMETSLRRWGNEFGMFAFAWLEERGKFELLLQGRGSGRSPRMNELLGEYFERGGGGGNVGWIHWLRGGDVERGGRECMEQMKKVGVVGRKGGVLNMAVLGSIAKLAMIASSGNVDDAVQGKLNVAKLQRRVAPREDALIPIEELVRRGVEECEEGSEELAEGVVLAVEAIRGEGIEGMEEHVWRRCVERQVGMWEKVGSLNDGERREVLKNSALYRAASQVGVGVREVEEALKGMDEVKEYAKAAIKLLV